MEMISQADVMYSTSGRLFQIGMIAIHARFWQPV